jgi:hypothetical protein
MDGIIDPLWTRPGISPARFHEQVGAAGGFSTSPAKKLSKKNVRPGEGRASTG